MTPADAPIVGYKAIARAVSAAIQASCSVRTAKRYARQGRDHRLPVMIYPNRRAYLLPADLAVWARAWTAPRPSGARMPGGAVPTCPPVAPQHALAA